MSAGGPAKLSLRAPPHLPFVQAFPGIPAGPNRPAASVRGAVEVRVGISAIKAKWIRVEIRKFEQSPLLPPSSSVGHNSRGSGSITPGPTWDHVGEIRTLWQAPTGKEYDSLDTAEFKFDLPLPEAIPPSFDGGKGGGGVRYELVAALCYKAKGGIFKKDQAPIMKVIEHIRIVKHELHAGWPLYNTPEGRSVQGLGGAVSLFVERPGVAFGPTDRMVLTATLKSAYPTPFRLKGFECHLVEITTVFPVPSDQTNTKTKKPKAPPPPQMRRTVIAKSRTVLNETMGSGSEKSARLDLVVPGDKLSMTVKNARTFEITHECVVEAVMEGVQGKVIMPGIRCILGPLPRASTQATIRDIGHFDALCPPISTPAGSSQTPSTVSSPGPLQSTDPRQRPYFAGMHPINGYPPLQPLTQSQVQLQQQGQQPSSQPIQGFVAREHSRRKSSSTITTTTTTATTITQHTPSMAANEFGQSHHPSERMSSTMPNNPHARSPVSFPVPNPASRLSRSESVRRSIESMVSPTTGGADGESRTDRYSQSDMGHGDSYEARRSSTATTGTFGRWDLNLNSKTRENGPAASSVAQAPTTPVIANQRLSDSLSSPQVPRTPIFPSDSPAQSSSSHNNSGTVPPSSWIAPVSNEKEILYEQARARAAAAQHASGHSLEAIGMDDIAPPPEYAPPRPVKPVGEEYMPPPRPVSSYSDQPRIDPGATTPPLPGPSTLRAPAMMNSPIAPALSKEFLSAAEEKEQQKKRFEEANRRVVSGGGQRSSSDYAPPPVIKVSSGRATSPVIPRSTVASSSDHSIDYGTSSFGTPTLTTHPTSIESMSPSAPKPPAFSVIVQGAGASSPPLSAAEEKQRLRYEMAISNRDNHIRSVSQSTIPASPNTSADGIGPLTFVRSSTQFGVAGKEVHGDVHDDDPIPYDAVPPPSSSTGGLSTPSGSTGPTAPTTYMTAEEEKDLMRKRFEEAQQKVARAQGPQGHPPSLPDGSSVLGSGVAASARPLSNSASSQPLDARMGTITINELPSASTSASTSAAVPATFMSAEQEKEMMKKRYEEAQRRVSHANNRASITSTPPRTPPPFSPIITGMSSPSLGGLPTASSSESTRVVSGSLGNKGSSYMTAEQEKEMMRLRYEEAQSRVARARLSSSPPPPSFEASIGAISSNPQAGGPLKSIVVGHMMTNNSSSRSPYTPGFGSSSGGGGSGFMSAEEEKQVQRQRFEMAQNAVNHRMSLGQGPAPGTVLGSRRPSGTARPNGNGEGLVSYPYSTVTGFMDDLLSSSSKPGHSGLSGMITNSFPGDPLVKGGKEQAVSDGTTNGQTLGNGNANEIGSGGQVHGSSVERKFNVKSLNPFLVESSRQVDISSPFSSSSSPPPPPSSTLNPAAPPPPLPAKPPKEYIDLLSHPANKQVSFNDTAIANDMGPRVIIRDQGMKSSSALTSPTISALSHMSTNGGNEVNPFAPFKVVKGGQDDESKSESGSRSGSGNGSRKEDE